MSSLWVYKTVFSMLFHAVKLQHAFVKTFDNVNSIKARIKLTASDTVVEFFSTFHTTACHIFLFYILWNYGKDLSGHHLLTFIQWKIKISKESFF